MLTSTMLSLFVNGTVQNISAPEDWTSVYDAVRWIQLTMAILSIIGSGSIIVYVSFHNLIRAPEVQPLFLLSVTDLLLSLSWLIGAALFAYVCDCYVICYNLHTVQQIFYLSSFFYTLNYIGVLYRGLKEQHHSHLNGFHGQLVCKTRSCGRIAVALLCFFLPVTLMVPAFVWGNSDSCYSNFSRPYRCLLLHTGPLYPSHDNHMGGANCNYIYIYSTGIFLSAFLVTFLGIVVLMGKARALYRRCATSNGFLGGRQWTELRVLERRMLLYPTAFFFCWGPAIILAIIILARPEAVQGLLSSIFYILQALTSGSQGLLNCLVYGWTQQRFRKLSKCAVRDVDTQTPLLRSQKRSYSSLSYT